MEIKMYEKQIEKIRVAMESIDLMSIEDQAERLKDAGSLQKVLKDFGGLLLILKELRAENSIKAEDIKGSKNLSPLEDGTL